MKPLFKPLYGISFLLLTSCTTMNSEFSCNTTANDNCMTIEQIDAMTRFADEEKTLKDPNANDF